VGAPTHIRRLPIKGWWLSGLHTPSSGCHYRGISPVLTQNADSKIARAATQVLPPQDVERLREHLLDVTIQDRVRFPSANAPQAPRLTRLHGHHHQRAAAVKLPTPRARPSAAEETATLVVEEPIVLGEEFIVVED
jgi:hypothetical protein